MARCLARAALEDERQPESRQLPHRLGRRGDTSLALTAFSGDADSHEYSFSRGSAAVPSESFHGGAAARVVQRTSRRSIRSTIRCIPDGKIACSFDRARFSLHLVEIAEPAPTHWYHL